MSAWQPTDYRHLNPSHVYTVGLIFQMENYAPFDEQWMLLVKKDRPEWQAGRYNGAGGKVEPKEWPRNCVEREVFEETGISLAGAGRLICILHCSTPSDPYSVVYFYWALAPFEKMREAQQTPRKEPCRLLRVKDVMADNTGAILNLRWLVQMARNMMVGGEYATHFEIFERYDEAEPVVGLRDVIMDCTGERPKGFLPHARGWGEE
jgi:ADP-ribose pyrophosphatase YjhB (NUDIX family)